MTGLLPPHGVSKVHPRCSAGQSLSCLGYGGWSRRPDGREAAYCRGSDPRCVVTSDTEALLVECPCYLWRSVSEFQCSPVHLLFTLLAFAFGFTSKSSLNPTL